MVEVEDPNDNIIVKVSSKGIIHFELRFYDSSLEITCSPLYYIPTISKKDDNYRERCKKDNVTKETNSDKVRESR